MCPVSAKKGTGMEDLLQMVLWVAEEQQLMANPDKFAAGTVIEAHLDKKVGAVSTLLVQAGTLRVGDVVAAGQAFGKVRTLVNDLGQNITSAGPSIAVQLFGLNQVPQAGDEFQVGAGTDLVLHCALHCCTVGARTCVLRPGCTSGARHRCWCTATLLHSKCRAVLLAWL